MLGAQCLHALEVCVDSVAPAESTAWSRLAYLLDLGSEFIEEAKAGGLVTRAIKAAGLHGIQVAPADGKINAR